VAATRKERIAKRKNIIDYKGYTGKIEFDDEASIFHGEVLDLSDVITFQGTCVDDLRQAFEDSVDDYLEFCEELGREPEKPYSGNFVLRVDPKLHRELTVRAKSENMSLNQWIGNKLMDALT